MSKNFSFGIIPIFQWLTARIRYTNEINRDIHLVFTLFKQESSMCYWFSLALITSNIDKSRIKHLSILSNEQYYINITFFTGWHFRLSPRGKIVNRGGADVDNAFRGVSIYNVTPWRMLYLFYYTEYAIFHRRETLPCNIQNCHPAKSPIRLLEINMRYNKYIYRSELISCITWCICSAFLCFVVSVMCRFTLSITI